MRQVKSFRHTNHYLLELEINGWLSQHGAVAISISVTYNPPHFHAFLIYEKVA